MLKFYECDAIQIDTEDTTLTQESSIEVEADSKVLISFYVPLVVAGVRIYRSSVSNEEKLLIDIPLPDSFRAKPEPSSLFYFVDDGSLVLGVDDYPTTSSLTTEEQRAVPLPVFTLSSQTGGTLPANTYYYRIAYYTKKDISCVYTEKEVRFKYYKPDLSKVMVYSRQDLTTETGYTLIEDPFTYVSGIASELLYADVFLNSESYVSQDLLFGGSFVKKIVYPTIPVNIKTDANNVLVGQPVLLNVSPSDVEIQVLENSLKGTPQNMLGTVVRVFAEETSISYFPSDAAKLLFNIAGGNLQVFA